MDDESTLFDLSTQSFYIFEADTGTKFGAIGHSAVAADPFLLDLSELGWQWQYFANLVPDGKAILHTAVLGADIKTQYVSYPAAECTPDIFVGEVCQLDKADEIIILYHPSKRQIYFQLRNVAATDYDAMESVINEYGGVPNEVYRLYTNQGEDQITEGVVCEDDVPAEDGALASLRVYVAELDACVQMLPLHSMNGLWRGDVVTGASPVFARNNGIEEDEYFLLYNHVTWDAGQLSAVRLTDDLPPFPVIKENWHAGSDTLDLSFRSVLTGSESVDLDGEIVEWNWSFLNADNEIVSTDFGETIEANVSFPGTPWLEVVSDTGQRVTTEQKHNGGFTVPDFLENKGIFTEQVEYYDYFNRQFSESLLGYDGTSLLWDNVRIVNWRWTCVDDPEDSVVGFYHAVIQSTNGPIDCSEVIIDITTEDGTVHTDTRDLVDIRWTSYFQKLEKKYPFQLVASKTDVTVGDPITLSVMREDFPDHKPYVKYFWGQGEPSNIESQLSSMTKTYSEPGLYVELVSAETGHQRRYSDAVAITVSLPPNVDPVANITNIGSVEVGVELLLDATQSFDSDGEIISYSWSAGGVHYNDAITSHTFSRAGTYSVQLTIEDDRGGLSVATVSIVVDCGDREFDESAASGCMEPEDDTDQSGALSVWLVAILLLWYTMVMHVCRQRRLKYKFVY